MDIDLSKLADEYKVKLQNKKPPSPKLNPKKAQVVVPHMPLKRLRALPKLATHTVQQCDDRNTIARKMLDHPLIAVLPISDHLKGGQQLVDNMSRAQLTYDMTIPEEEDVKCMERIKRIKTLRLNNPDLFKCDDGDRSPGHDHDTGRYVDAEIGVRKPVFKAKILQQWTNDDSSQIHGLMSQAHEIEREQRDQYKRLSNIEKVKNSMTSSILKAREQD